MSSSGGQSDAPSVKFPSKLGTHLPTHQRGERLSQHCPAWGLNLRPLAWKCDALTTQPLGFKETKVHLNEGKE
ncbi:hypothetical protein TNCV_2211141 [Trichonephila clavipes]|nr:hypothetical protein TNCV_2211141 [Trichonephila clavipes]